MAVDAYMTFKPYNKPLLDAESQVDFSKNSEELSTKPSSLTAGKVFEVEEYNFDIEQTLNIGSQSSGAGAGKVTFNPFSITRSIDIASPILYQMACSGTAFETVTLALRKSMGAGGGGEETSGGIFLRFDFKLVAVKTISWAHDETSPKETVSFEYGGLQMRYMRQKAEGSFDTVIAGGWNRVKNIQDLGTDKLS